jgi:hypothetical protein
MANQKEANLAREQHSDYLRNLGAHSIAVDHVEDKGLSVIAFFDKKPPKDIPETLEVKSGDKTVTVPLVAEVMKMPKPE